MAGSSELLAQIERSFRSVWYYGAVTEIGAHGTGWQSSPSSGMVQIHGLRTWVECRGVPSRWAEDGSAIVIGAQGVHRLTSTCTGPGPGRCRYASLDFFVLGGIDVLTLYEVPVVIAGARAQVIGDACEALAALHARPPEDAVRHATERMSQSLRILHALLEGASATPRGMTLMQHAARIEPVLSWIDAHLGQPADLAGLARLAGLSPSRLHALFRQVVRASPMAYRARRRIQRAQQLLLTTEQPVQEIAQALGFADAFHFSKVFRRVTGHSPRTYRLRAGPLQVLPARRQP